MRRRILCESFSALLFVVLGATALVRAQQAGTSQVAATGAQAVRADVWFTVEDRNGRCVSPLRAEDMRVLEDGAAQQIDSFASPHDAARSFVVAVDNSMSQTYMLAAVKRVAKALISALVRPQKDRVAVLSFADEATLEHDFTDNAAQAQKAVEGIFAASPEVPFILAAPPEKQKKPPGSTSLQDALWLIGGEVFATTPADARRVVVLLTDGRDTASEVKKRDSLARLFGANAVVYAIGVGDSKNFDGIDKHTLEDLTERTGGRAYFPRKDPEVRAVFTEIEQSLDCQNLLSYTSSNPDATKGFRKLKVEIANPELRKQGLRVSHQEAYVFGGTPDAKKRK